jgi:L-threonylcarbamoyladenylate synthase
VSARYDCTRPAARESGIEAAVRALRAGGVVVFPTDSSYAVGCDAFSREAAAAIRRLRGLPEDAPLSILVGSWNTVHGVAHTVSGAARELIEGFWPGGLSLVVEHAPSLVWDIGDTGGAVIVRMPLHPIALELLREVGPMIASVAPAADGAEPRTLDPVEEHLSYKVAVYLDAGELEPQGRSTIVDLTGPQAVLRREGSVSLAELTEVTGLEIVPG